MPPFLQFLIRRILAIPVTLFFITLVLFGGVMLTPPEARAALYMPNSQRNLTDEQEKRLIEFAIACGIHFPFNTAYG